MSKRKSETNGQHNRMRIVEVESDGVCFRIGGKDIPVHDIAGTLRKVEVIRANYENVKATDANYGGWFDDIKTIMRDLSGQDFNDTEVRAFCDAMQREWVAFEDNQKKMLDAILTTAESRFGIQAQQPSQ